MQRLQISKKRSQGSLGSVTNSSAASLRNRSNEVERMDSRSTRKFPQKKYVTLAIRSERYIRLSPEQKPTRDLEGDSKDREIVRLQKWIEEYKYKYEKALKAVEKLSKAMEGQNNKYFLEKQVY